MNERRIVKTLRHMCCLILLLPILCIRAHAAHELDGVVGRTEYAGNMQQLISARYESNNDVSLAYLFWDVSAEDYSLYIAVKYMCDDVGVLLDKMDRETETDAETTEPEPDAAAAVELSVNGEVCATAYMDGSFPDMDRNRYDAESKFSFARSTTGKPETSNFVTEIRLGLKYWMPYDSTLGIRIYDCSGRPSNLYTVVVNPAPIQTTQPDETTAAAKTSAASAAVSATDPPKTTRRVILAAKASVKPPAESSATVAETTAKVKETVPKTKKVKTTKVKTTRAAKIKSASTAKALQTAEPGTTVPSEETQSAVLTPDTQAAKIIRRNHLRDIGHTVGTILLTLAVTFSIFYGIQAAKQKKGAQNASAETDAAANMPDDHDRDDF